jgi:hypothetical protein
MVRRIDENGFRWLEPPYTPEEQMLLGGKPPFPGSVHAETFSVSVDATYERYRDVGLSGFDLTFYYAYGTNLLNATVNGKVLGHEAAQILEAAITGEDSREEWMLVASAPRHWLR